MNVQQQQAFLGEGEGVLLSMQLRRMQTLFTVWTATIDIILLHVMWGAGP
jgi:hypothetical protein